MAVMDELEQEDLMRSARKVGDYALARLGTLQNKYEMIGDIRGSGLIFGAELVSDRSSKTAATELTDTIVNAMRHRGIIHSCLGRNKNTLKIRPPMPFTLEHAEFLFDTLDEVLQEHG